MLDSWRAVARKLEEKLEDERGRKTLLDKLAAEIRALNIVVAEKDVLFGGGAGKYPRLLLDYCSALEYCLFAPHRDSGLPLVAHVAHHGIAGTFGPRLMLSSVSGFGRTLGAEDVEALCDVVGRYAAEERRGVVPATAFPPFLVGPNHQHLLGTRRWPMSGPARAGNLSSRIVERAFKRHGWAMAPATTRNRLGETQLMTFLRQIPPLELLRSFMDHVPGAQEAVDEPNNEDGFTPAHLCARLDLADHLQVLLDLGGADVHVKDHKGRTVLDLAETLEATDTLELLAGLEWLIGGPPGQTKTGMEAAAVPHGNFDFSRVDLSRFPRIHLPSVPDGVPEKRTGEVLMSYVRSEVPQLLTNKAAGPVPPTILPPLEWSQGAGHAGDAAAICPYPEGNPHATGWRAENRAVNAVIRALTELLMAREDGTPPAAAAAAAAGFSGLQIACFPGLRFGGGSSHWNDVDLAVMGFDLETGAHAVLLVEVKSITRARDVVGRGARVRTQGSTRALEQLASHIRDLERDLGIRASRKWVIPCLALPLCPRTDGGGAEEARLKDEWDAFMERADASDDSWMRACVKFRPRLLTRPMLESPDRLGSFLLDELLTTMTASVSEKMGSESTADSSISDGDASAADESTKRRAPALVLLAWFLLNAVGVPVLPRNNRALLTGTQLRALQLGPGPHPGSAPPLLIVGGAGTGKTFLAVEKLIKCERERLVDDDECERAALFLTHSKNSVARVKLVTAQLKRSGAEFVRVECVATAGAGGGTNKDLLLAHLRQAARDGTHFVVLDRLEDFYSDDGDDDLASDELSPASLLLSSLLGLDCFRMFWITVNPFDVPEAHREELSARLLLDNSSSSSSSCSGQKKKSSSGVLVLDKRIRNARGLGVLVDRLESTTSSSSMSWPVGLVPEPASGTLTGPTRPSGAPVVWGYLFRDKQESGLSSLARVLRKLLPDEASVRSKHILVIRTAQQQEMDSRQRLLLLDPHLISEFGKAGRMMTAPPLLVRAAWVGDIEDSLMRDDGDELERVREYLEGVLLLPLSPPEFDVLSHEKVPASSDAASLVLLLQTRFRELVREYADTGRWPRAPRGHLPTDSVAFQAALSLVNRVVSLSSSISGSSTSVVMADDDSSSTPPMMTMMMRELVEALGSTSKKTSTSDAAPHPQRQHQLRNMILRHRCISLLDMSEARGYEADTVIVWDPTTAGDSISDKAPARSSSSLCLDDVMRNYVRMLALAKVQAVLVAPDESIGLLQRRLVGPFGIRFFFPSAFGRRANGTLKEYVKMELPNFPGRSESLLLVLPQPWIWDSGAARTADDAMGSQHAAELFMMKFLQEDIVPALRKLHGDCEPHLDVACFRDLRYGCSRHARRRRRRRGISMRTAASREGVLSAVIMCFNKTTGAYMVAVFQAAEPSNGDPRRIRVCVPLTNRPVGSSSSRSGGGGDGDSQADKEPQADTIQPCISLADCEDDDHDDEYEADGELGQRWQEFLWSAAQCQDAREEVAADSGFTIVGQTNKSAWVDLERLTGGIRSSGRGRREDWLQTFLATVSITDSSSEAELASSKIDDTRQMHAYPYPYPYAYRAVLDWCVMHCTGVVVRHISEGIDDRSRAITAHPALVPRTPAAATLLPSSNEPPGGPPPSASIITADDDDASSGASSRLLIVGGGGTGKTLLALQRLINCEKVSGSINATNRGLFLTHEKNRALIVQVRRLLEKNETQFIQVCAFPSDNTGGLKSFLEAIVEDIKDSNIRFVVFDQLEDVMIAPSSDTPHQQQQQQQLPADPTTIHSVMSVKGFRMLWATLNPFDAAAGPECHASLWSYLSDPNNSSSSPSSVLLLDTRVRNTTEIGALLERADAAAVSLPPFLVAEPAYYCCCFSSSHERAGTAAAGGRATPTAAFPPLWGVPVFAEPFLLGPGGQHRTLAEVLHHLLLYLGVAEEDVLVVDTGEHSKQQQQAARPSPYSVNDHQQTESALVKTFCEPRNRRVPSMAPLLVRAAWVGRIEDCLREEDLRETKRRLVGAGPPSTSLVGTSTSSPPASRDDADAHHPSGSSGCWLRHFEERLEEYERGEGPWSSPDDDELFNSAALQATLSLVRRFVGWTQRQNISSAPHPPAAAAAAADRATARTDPFIFVKELAEAVTDASSTRKLRDLILKNRCVSLLDSGQVGGAEANVVVFRDSAQHFAAHGRGISSRHQHQQVIGRRAYAGRLLSRAKIIAVVATENPDETVFGSLDNLYFG